MSLYLIVKSPLNHQEAPFVMDAENPTADEPYMGFCVDFAKEVAKIVGFKVS